MKTGLKLVLMAMSVMIGGFSWAAGLQINPLKENMARFEAGIKEAMAQFKAKLERFKIELKEIKALLIGQNGLKSGKASNSRPQRGENSSIPASAQI